MTAAPAQLTSAGPTDSLEARWIIAGPLQTAVRDWFARFPGRTGTRDDTYLIRPRLEGLSVKLRDASTLEVKSYLGSPGILALPASGQARLESWRKWSFPSHAPPQAGLMLAGWVTVRKTRRSTWFPLPASQEPAPGPSPDGTGCTAELAEAEAGDRQWWTVGLEATGPAGLLPDAVQHATSLLFTQPPPAGADFTLGHSRS